MVTFEKPPTDEELRGFVDLQDSSSSVRLLDAVTTLTARPQPMPMWFFWACLLVPDAVIVGTLVWMNPFAAADPFTRVWGYLVAGSIPVVTVVTWVMFGELVRRQVERGDFFTLNR